MLRIGTFCSVYLADLNSTRSGNDGHYCLQMSIYTDIIAVLVVILLKKSILVAVMIYVDSSHICS